MDTSVPAVITAYEERIRVLEEEKIAVREKMANAGRPARDFDSTLRTALSFLASPWKIWQTGQLEDRRAVLKLAFAGRLEYTRNEGPRTVDLSLPFKMLTQICGDKREMAHPTSASEPEKSL